MLKEKRRSITGGHGLLSGVMLLAAANVFVKIMGFFYKVPLNAVLGDEMANVNAAYSIYVLLYTVSTAGVPNAVSLSVSRARAAHDRGLAERILRVSLGALFSLGVLLSLLLALLARPLSLLNSGGDSYLCLLAIAPALAFSAANSVLRGYFQGFERMEPTAISELLEALGKTVIGLVLAYLALHKLNGDTQTAAALAVFAITAGVGMSAGYLALRYRKEQKGIPPSSLARQERLVPSRTVLLGILRLALPITLTSAMMSLSSLLDAQLMRPLLSGYYQDAAWAKAIYSDYSTGALTLYNLPMVLITPLTAAMIPYVSRTLAAGEKGKAAYAMETALRAAAALSLPCAFGLSALASPILAFVFRGDGDMAQNVGPLLSVLALAVFFSAVFTVTGGVLQAAEKEKLPLVSLGVGVVVKLASLVLLTRRFGEIGVPVSTVLFFVTVSLLNLLLMRRAIGIRVRFAKSFLKPALAAILAATIAVTVYRFLISSHADSLCLLASILLCALFYALFLLLFRCVGKEELMMLPPSLRSKFVKISKKWK